MPEKTQLFISEPCHEQWSHMQPDTDGRFCGSCRKTVVDFSMMNDQEILLRLAGKDTSVCGRFTETQLNRELLAAHPPKKNRWMLWNFLLAGLLLSSEVSAQKESARPRVSHTDSNLLRMPLILGNVSRTIPDNPDRIRARLVDSVTGLPLSWASIKLGKNKGQLMADKDGEFDISTKLVRRSLSLDITAVGYEESVVVADKSWIDGRKKVIEISRSAQDLPAVAIVGYGLISCRHVTGSVTTVRSNSDSLQQIVKDTLAYFGLVKKPFAVYPNPVARGAAVTLSVQTGVAGDYVVQLFSSGGALVESMRIEGVDGKRTELLNIPGTTAAGLYFVRLFHAETGKLYTEKLVVL